MSRRDSVRRDPKEAGGQVHRPPETELWKPQEEAVGVLKCAWLLGVPRRLGLGQDDHRCSPERPLGFTG